LWLQIQLKCKEIDEIKRSDRSWIAFTHGCGEVGTSQRGRHKDHEVEQFLGGDATGAEYGGLLQPLILGHDADEQLDDRDEGHHVEDGGDSGVVGQIEDVALVARVPNVADAGVVDAIAPSRAAEIVVRRKGAVDAHGGRLAVPIPHLAGRRLQRRLQNSLRATH